MLIEPVSRWKLLATGIAIAGALAAPLTWTPAHGVTVNEACAASGGTCCPEGGAICYPDNGAPQINYYWRGDGKKCSAPDN